MYRIHTKLCSAVKVMGKCKFGLKAHKIGCHSIFSRAAMALVLAHVPVLTITIIGCWRSNAFLCYICKQVALFSQNLTDKILQVESFFTMPDFHRVKQADQKIAPSPRNCSTENDLNWSWGV